MKSKFGSRLLVILFAVALIASCAAMHGLTPTNLKSEIAQNSERDLISLAPPSFIGITSAAETTGNGGAFPAYKVGISAYINTNMEIDIEKMKTIFTEVEEVGENYIIGITPIPDFGGGIGVHVYADTDGWIVAYLENNEPTSKIMQWGTQTWTTLRLQR